MQEKHNELFANAPVWKAIGKMAVPAMITMLVMILYNTADLYFVGLTKDMTQVAAVSLISPAYSIMMAFGSMLGGGGCALIARNLGKGNFNSIKVYSSICCWSSLALGLLFTGTAIFGKNMILHQLGANEYIWHHAETYLEVIAIGAPVMIFTTAFSSIIRAEGAVRESMIGNLLSTVTNIVLDPIFILGMKMGVGGAAVATVISNIVGAIYLINYIYRKKSSLSLHPIHVRQHPQAIGRILAIGAPNAINSFMTGVSSVFANRLLIGYGTAAVAAMGAASKSVRITSFVQMGLCIGVQPMLAYCYGAKNILRLREIIKKLIILTVAVGTGLAVFCLFNSKILVALFLNDSSAIALGQEMISILIISGPFIGLYYLGTSFLQSSGNAPLASATALLRQGIFFIPLIYLMNSLFHVTGNIYAHLVADAAATVVVLLLAYRQFRILKQSDNTRDCKKTHQNICRIFNKKKAGSRRVCMDDSRYILEPPRKTLVIEADVFVAGAGTAGCIAAIAAARMGAKVVLVEKMPVPGGTFTNGGIGVNSYFASTDNVDNAKRIVGGIAYELAERLEAAGGATGFVPIPNDHYHSPYRFIADHEIFKGVISEMLLEAGITVFLQTMFCGVLTEEERITAAIIENKNGRSAVVANQYIDASGDGDVAKFAGLEQVELWQDYDQVCGGPTGLVFGMAGIDFDRMLAENPRGALQISEPVTAEGNRLPMRRVAFVHNADPEKYSAFQGLDIEFFTSLQSIHNGEATYINNSMGVKIDGSTAEGLTAAELEMRIRIVKMAQAFKACVPGFETSYISWASTQIGVRASKITICDKLLTQAEITEATRFEDEIGLYAFHDLSPKREHCLVKTPGFYGMPYRMLLPKGCSNMFMAGRCVTLDLEAHMSTRNMVGCMIMGQAAGVAAALCAKKSLKSRDLPYANLREALIQQKVILDT